jgi:hypothetical protein
MTDPDAKQPTVEEMALRATEKFREAFYSYRGINGAAKELLDLIRAVVREQLSTQGETE